MMECPKPDELYVVMGLARSGLAAARLLLARGCRIRVTDLQGEEAFSREIGLIGQAAEACPGRVEFSLGGHPENLLDDVRAVILSPGIPLTVPFLQAARRRGIPVWSEVELASRCLRGVMVGITGSNGKSTTTALTAHLLCTSGMKALAVGNIGQPISAFAAGDGPPAIFVTELSSFQLECIETLRPKVGMLLNITQNHLDRYPSMDEYAAAKWNMFRNMGEGDYAILNAEDPRVCRGSDSLRCPVWYFSAQPAEHPDRIRGAGICRDQLWLNTGHGAFLVMEGREVPLPGRHNLENALAAALAASLLGASPVEIRNGIMTFSPLPHRLELVGELEGRRFYNDSKATTVESVLVALAAFGRGTVLILGGKDKGSDFRPLAPVLAEKGTQVLLLGQAADKIAHALGSAIPSQHVKDLAEAVRRGFELAPPGGVVLLSPACASFDMFNNFEHRGDVFREEVGKFCSTGERS